MIFYFTSENIFSFNSGTEFSQAKRTKLFNLENQSAFYVARNYNPNFHQVAWQMELSDGQVINMYDYFQEATNVTRKKINVRFASFISKRDYHLDSVNPNYSLIKYHGQTSAKVNIAPLTVGLVGNVEYYDSFGNTEAIDYWDWRGFKSSTQYFHPNGQPGAQRFFSPEGKLVMEIVRMNISGKLFPTMYKLFDYKGKDWRFDSENELFIFFMNELISQRPGIIINDRPSMMDVVARISGETKKFQYLHDVHTIDSGNPIKGEIMTSLKPLFTTYSSAYNGIIVATSEQRNDLKKRYPRINIYQAPDTYIDQEQLEKPQKSYSLRVSHKLLYFGRLSEEKHPEQTIRAFSVIKQTVPDATLEFRGYPSSSAFMTSLKKQVVDAGLKESVTFCNYVTGDQRNRVLDQAELVIQTSTGEGFSMSVLEAMSHGLPAVVYDANYGPRSFVRDSFNGYLIENGNFVGLADNVIKIFQNNSLWQKLSFGAYQTARAFDAKNVWSVWQKSGIFD
ncbi:accessory Sec system glycosyltransferase Asp1 [Oenococcus sp. UCMA 14587]|nr:accessory Sec system glycosyltransferase Asp1 [Oenococcus sp. UCMA 14587]